MYEFIEGKLSSIEPTYIIIKCQGIGYRIYCPNPFSWQTYLKQDVICYLELVVREDAQHLYGFMTIQERDLFLTLNKVSGIGPKSAMSILAIGDNQGLMQAIEQGDSKYLMKFPGVGRKTAQQMILDLSGKLADFNLDQTTENNEPNLSIKDEVSQALLGLGYSQREINKIDKYFEQESFASTQEALSFAFKQLIKS